MRFRTIIVIALFSALLPTVALTGAWSEADPLAAARAVADHELFGAIQAPGARPSIRVHHDWDWLDGTLMSGIAYLSDRLDQTGASEPRYADYLEQWGRHHPGGLFKPISHGDHVCAGFTYLWLFERSGKTSDHLKKTDRMMRFIKNGRDRGRVGSHPPQSTSPYNDYWMRFWNDDIHMVPPVLARRGRLVGSAGVPDGKDGRALAMEYLRAYADILQDKATGLYWHDRDSIGKYMWGRGNGWAAGGMVKVHEELILSGPEWAADAAWIREQLVKMAATLKDNRNQFGTWNADVLNRAEYTEPETSGSAFFVYMLAYMVNRGYLPKDEYGPVVEKAWGFLADSVSADGHLNRTQPVGRGPIKTDFSTHSETYGVGAFCLAAVEVSRMDR